MTDNDPIRLKDAAEQFGLTVGELRAEAGRGRLAIYRIGKRDYTTANDIREMVEQCRVERKDRAFTVTRRATSGPSATAAASCDSAQQAILKLRNSSRSTSPASTGPRLARVR